MAALPPVLSRDAQATARELLQWQSNLVLNTSDATISPVPGACCLLLCSANKSASECFHAFLYRVCLWPMHALPTQILANSKLTVAGLPEHAVPTCSCCRAALKGLEMPISRGGAWCSSTSSSRREASPSGLPGSGCGPPERTRNVKAVYGSMSTEAAGADNMLLSQRTGGTSAKGMLLLMRCCSIWPLAPLQPAHAQLRVQAHFHAAIGGDTFAEPCCDTLLPVSELARAACCTATAVWALMRHTFAPEL